MERMTIVEQYMRIAQLISERGSCHRLKVGCLIAKENRIVSTGYNGILKNEQECDFGILDQHCVEASCIHAVHAEANAIYAAARMGISLQGSLIYCTHSPCTDCVEAIVQAGICKVYFGELFRDQAPLTRLRSQGLLVEQVILNPLRGIKQTIEWF